VLNVEFPPVLDIFLDGMLFGILLASWAIACRGTLEGDIVSKGFAEQNRRDGLKANMLFQQEGHPETFLSYRGVRENLGNNFPVLRLELL
jgi:hypothetical protein